MPLRSDDIAGLDAILHEYAGRYETEAFLAEDPALFMHLVNGTENQETMAFIASCLSYGSRKQFFPKIRFILNVSEKDIFRWVKDGRFDTDIPDTAGCYYRLYTCRDMNTMLRTLQMMFVRHGSLGSFVRNNATDGLSAVNAITSFFREHGSGGIIPKDTSSACKRLCMFMRWMTRSGSPVDLGLWSDFIDRRSLIMPLDTHVMQQANRLNLLSCTTTSMATALRLTDKMRKIFPDDPLKGDFALFGYGVSHGH